MDKPKRKKDIQTYVRKWVTIHKPNVTRPLQLLAAHYEHYARYYEGGMLDGTVNLAAEEKLCSALTVYRLLDSLAKKVRVLRGDLSLGS